jgi:hypothetical protein
MIAASLLSRSIRPFARASVAVWLSLVVACSASATDLSGCWAGCWKSCATGHQGKLRATITKVDDTRYCARFSGTFFKIIPFRYSTMLNAAEDGDAVKLSGSSYLGRLMGTFYYDGTANDCSFDMNYSACKDCGVFKMQREATCGCCR